MILSAVARTDGSDSSVAQSGGRGLGGALVLRGAAGGGCRSSVCTGTRTLLTISSPDTYVLRLGGARRPSHPSPSVNDSSLGVNPLLLQREKDLPSPIKKGKAQELSRRIEFALAEEDRLCKEAERAAMACVESASYHAKVRQADMDRHRRRGASDAYMAHKIALVLDAESMQSRGESGGHAGGGLHPLHHRIGGLERIDPIEGESGPAQRSEESLSLSLSLSEPRDRLGEETGASDAATSRVAAISQIEKDLGALTRGLTRGLQHAPMATYPVGGGEQIDASHNSHINHSNQAQLTRQEGEVEHWEARVPLMGEGERTLQRALGEREASSRQQQGTPQCTPRGTLIGTPIGTPRGTLIGTPIGTPRGLGPLRARPPPCPPPPPTGRSTGVSPLRGRPAPTMPASSAPSRP